MYLIKSKLIVLLATILFLSSCAGVKPIQIRTVEETTPIQHPDLPNPIKLQDVEWHVITEDNLDEFIQMLKDTRSHVVFFAITPDDYELMKKPEAVHILLDKKQDELGEDPWIQKHWN